MPRVPRLPWEIPMNEDFTGARPSRARRPGSSAEDLACVWLEWRGWQILDRNRRAGRGEIDIVAREELCLVFVEVRSRRRGSWVSAAESIRGDKARRLRDCARCLAREPALAWPGRRLRFDVVALEASPSGLSLRHFRNVRLGAT